MMFRIPITFIKTQKECTGVTQKRKNRMILKRDSLKQEKEENTVIEHVVVADEFQGPVHVLFYGIDRNLQFC